MSWCYPGRGTPLFQHTSACLHPTGTHSLLATMASLLYVAGPNSEKGTGECQLNKLPRKQTRAELGGRPSGGQLPSLLAKPSAMSLHVTHFLASTPPALLTLQALLRAPVPTSRILPGYFSPLGSLSAPQVLHSDQNVFFLTTSNQPTVFPSPLLTTSSFQLHMPQTFMLCLTPLFILHPSSNP